MSKDIVARSTNIRVLLEQAKPRLASVLPRHMSVDRLIRITLAAVSQTPKLAECTADSVLFGVMKAAQLGLEPGVLGGCYLVPFSNKGTMEAVFIPGYRGLIDLARRSGQIESIEAHVVFEKDRFLCHYGLDPKLEHEPFWGEEPGGIMAVYAIAKLKDGGKQLEVMTKAQIDRIRARSKSGSSGPWVTDYPEMARKTVVRRLCKYLPLSPELADAMESEDRVEEDRSFLPATTADVLARISKVRPTAPAVALEMSGNDESDVAEASDAVVEPQAVAEPAAEQGAQQEPENPEASAELSNRVIGGVRLLGMSRAAVKAMLRKHGAAVNGQQVDEAYLATLPVAVLSQILADINEQVDAAGAEAIAVDAQGGEAQ